MYLVSLALLAACSEDPLYYTPAGNGANAGSVADGGGGSVASIHTCLELLVCLDECNSGDVCGDACVRAASSTARSDLTALLDCRETRCGDPDAGANCLDARCPTEMRACSLEASVSPWPVSCADTVDCFVDCDGDDQCVDGCFAPMTSARAAAYDLITCVRRCADHHETSCVDVVCAEQMQRCAAL